MDQTTSIIELINTVPIIQWANGNFSGGDRNMVELVRKENQAAISWFNAQNFHTPDSQPHSLGEAHAAEYHFEMASHARDAGIVREAWAGYHQALRRYMMLNDQRMIGLTCFNLGKIYGAQSNWEMANIMFRHSAYITNKIGDQKGYAWSLVYYGDTCTRLGRNAARKQCLQQAYNVFLIVSPSDAQNMKKALEKL